MKKSIVAALVIVMVLSALAGCSGGGQEKPSNNAPDSSSSDKESPVSKKEIRISWWGSQSRHDLTMKALDLFMEKNPDIKVTAEFSGWDGYWDKLNVQTSGGNAPDLMQMHLSYLSNYVTRGLVADLSAAMDYSDVAESSLAIGKHEGGLYAIPAGLNSYVMMYNPALYEKAGITIDGRLTWDEFTANTKQVAEKLGDGFYGSEDFSTEFGGFFEYFVRQKGENLYDGNQLGFTEETLAAWFQYWTDLRTEGVIPDAQLANSYSLAEYEKTLLVTGKGPVKVDGSNQIGTYEKLANQPFEMMLYPTMDGGQEGHALSAGILWSINADSKHPEEVKKLLDFLTHDPEAADILGATRGVPISSNIRERLSASLNDADRKQFNIIDELSAVARPLNSNISPKGSAEVKELFENTAQSVQFGEMAPDAAAKKFVKEANDILSKQSD
ncbi:sugar ABC transporter substrate-binding protein [Paenibacillus sp. J5C_2022]|uniref:ABC transporter substrate-binding protein n=1 Tax=Paenibacillus sp. J5C2022 TaxID=2977129 RepID=UPI0021D0E1B5|nr:sugar ABC transporter substrate-binding protein [Paenibacillus sp. J5C2022]MCU6707360.1 sugar ABC transporter substrate-binding protein [Paenibacillus sp. J5C2022]